MPEVALSGRLEHVTLPSLLQLVEAESTSGRIRLADRAELALAGGRVVGARFDAAEGRPALLEAFLLGAGPFAVELGPASPGRPLAETLELVMTGCRLVDEWARLGPSGARVDRPVDDPQLAPLLPHLSAAPIEEAVRRAGLLRAAVIDPLLSAVERGWISLVAPPAPPPSAGEVGAWVDEARARTRERRYAEAEQLLERALRADPADRVIAQNLARVRALKAATEASAP